MKAMWFGIAAAVVIAVVAGVILGASQISSADLFSSASARL